jgi:hypothetical protein
MNDNQFSKEIVWTEKLGTQVWVMPDKGIGTVQKEWNRGSGTVKYPGILKNESERL